MHATAFSHGQTTRPLRFFHSLRFRLMLWYLLILGLVLCIFSTAIYFTEGSTLYQSLETVLDATIDGVTRSYRPTSGRLSGTNVDALLILQNPQGQITQVSSTEPTPAIPALSLNLSQIKDWGHGLLWENSQITHPFAAADGQALRFTRRGAPVFSEILSGPDSYAMQRIIIANQQGQLLAFLYVGVPSAIPNQLQQLLLILAVTAPLVLLLSSVGGYWLAGRATRPVQTLTRTAQESSATRAHRRPNSRPTTETLAPPSALE